MSCERRGGAETTGCWRLARQARCRQVAPVNGQQNLPLGGQLTSRLADTGNGSVRLPGV
jgi:hypothetical protein